MLSSTSSSERAPIARWRNRLAALSAPWKLFAVAVAVLAVLELTCRFVLPGVIAVEAVRVREYQAATTATRSAGHQVLLLGNSLLGTGVDMSTLSRQVGAGIDVRRLMVEDTLYFDWLYGVRRLFADGARPDLVALVMAPEHIVSNRIRGEYTAYRLMRTRDTLVASARLELSNSASADLFLSSMSAFLGMRNNIRRRVLLGMVPGLKELMPRLNARAELALTPNHVQLMAERLREFRETCEKAGSRFVLVVPPTSDSSHTEAVRLIAAAASQSGTSVVVPVTAGELSKSDYSDGFHLHERGTELFTMRLAHALGGELRGIKLRSAEK